MIYRFAMTPDQFSAKSQQAKDAGITLTGASGHIEISTPVGTVAFEYMYDYRQEELRLIDTQKPWLLPESEINAKLQALFGPEVQP